jgi:meiotic recombination protein SPO11
VIEKEGVFQRILEDEFFNTIPCIILTACGFPDLASR